VKHNDGGFSSVEFLIVLVFLSVCAFAAGTLIKTAGVAAEKKNGGRGCPDADK